MFNLSKAWPLGLNRANWWRFALAFGVLLGLVVWFDHPVSAWAVGWPKPVTGFFASITDYGLSDWILIPALLMFILSGLLGLIIPKRAAKLALRQMAGIYAFIFIGVALPGLASNLIKRAIGRGRPEVFDQVGQWTFQSFINNVPYQSFPSGHTTTAFAFAFVVGFMARRWFPFLLLGAMAIGVSRVAVGAHYPTDVLGGAVLGTVGAYAVRALFVARGWVFTRTTDGGIEMRNLSAVRRLIQSRGRKA
jgi:membrane-associated phospholipid phosphatase